MVYHLVLVAVRLLVVILGSVLAYLSYDIYRRRRAPPILGMFIAFTLITLGAVVEGVLFEFMDYSLTQVHAIEAAITAAGLAVVLLAIHGTR